MGRVVVANFTQLINFISLILTLQQAKNALLSILIPQYGEQEARAIADRFLILYFEVPLIDILLNKIVEKPHDWEQKLFRLEKGEPFQYIIGKEFFHQSVFLLNPHTLIPRPETEELVDWILEEQNQENLAVLDIGTGSGCIPISLSLQRPHWDISAWDISSQALEQAQENAQRLGASVHFQLTDALNIPPTNQQWDLIISNPPYVCQSEKSSMKPHVLNYEPALALFVDDLDPLIFYEKILIFAKNSLKLHGKIYFEINPIYLQELESLAKKLEFQEFSVRQDFRGKDRMVKIG